MSQELSSRKSALQMPVMGSWKSQELCSAEKRAVTSKISSKQTYAGHTYPLVRHGWLTTTLNTETMTGGNFRLGTLGDISWTRMMELVHM